MLLSLKQIVRIKSKIRKLNQQVALSEDAFIAEKPFGEAMSVIAGNVINMKIMNLVKNQIGGKYLWIFMIFHALE